MNYTPNVANVDGIHWMSNSDFLRNYKNIYICRELTEKAGWYTDSLEGKWEGPSAAGLNTKKLRNVP